MLLRKLHLCLLGATLATAVLTTGCQSPAPTETVTSQPAQPAQSETVIYNKWETETHRPHKEIAQRPADEQKQYHDWRQAHPEYH
jgi:PBP1b-binding outer membrane lipoprotein LpoB